MHPVLHFLTANALKMHEMNVNKAEFFFFDDCMFMLTNCRVVLLYLIDWAVSYLKICLYKSSITGPDTFGIVPHLGQHAMCANGYLEYNLVSQKVGMLYKI